MWSTNKKDRCLRTTLLVINCAASVAIVYLYFAYTSKEHQNSVVISTDGVIHAEKLTDEKCIPVCDSEACIWHANALLRNMDLTVDPCENFDSFLCGGFKQKFSAEEKAHVVTESATPMLNRLKVILENIQAEPESASAKLKTVYNSCINYKSSEFEGITEFKRFFNKLEFLQESNMSLPTVLGKVIANGATEYGRLSRDFETIDEFINNSFKIHSFDNYFFEEHTKIPREAAISILKYFDLDTASMETIINDHQLVRNSIISLYESTVTCEENCSGVYQVDCSNKNNDDWRYLCETVEEFLKNLNVTNQASMKSLLIEKSDVDFYKNLFLLLNSLSDRSLNNFMILNFIKRFQGEFNFYFRLAKLKDKHFFQELESSSYEIGRFSYCVQWISKNMKEALINEFFHQYLTYTAIEELTDFFNDYVSNIIEMIDHQKWIPSEMKLVIEVMIRGIIFNVQALSQIFPNDTSVNEFYDKFHPTPKSFLDNVLKLKRHGNIINLTYKISNVEALSAIHFTDFDVQASAIHPFLVIHYGMLLPPYYKPGHKSLINRLFLALLQGHEIGHYLSNSLASSPEINDLYSEQQQCVRDQFSRFKFENLNESLDGSKYDGENMPDNVGTALIDKIIEKYYSEQEDVILPGLPYTTKQLLYMSANQMWCAKSNLEEELRHKNFTGNMMHAPSEFRIIGVMQNSRGYSEAFHCPDGSFMNPANKCSLIQTY